MGTGRVKFSIVYTGKMYHFTINKRTLQMDGRIYLIVTDVVMPNINGQEQAEKVRSRYHSTGIIFISGYGN